jgi:hypothetical protein
MTEVILFAEALVLLVRGDLVVFGFLVSFVVVVVDVDDDAVDFFFDVLLLSFPLVLVGLLEVTDAA